MKIDNFYIKQGNNIGFGIRHFKYLPSLWWWYLGGWKLEFHLKWAHKRHEKTRSHD